MTIVWSVSDVRSRRSIVGDSTASDTTGCVVLVVGADDQRVLDVAREARPHLRDLVAHVLHRLRHVGRHAELGEDLALALRASSSGSGSRRRPC